MQFTLIHDVYNQLIIMPKLHWNTKKNVNISYKYIPKKVSAGTTPP